MIWLGDLNYRLNLGGMEGGGSDEEVLRLLRAGGAAGLDAVLNADQLRREMAEGRVFPVSRGCSCGSSSSCDYSGSSCGSSNICDFTGCCGSSCD